MLSLLCIRQLLLGGARFGNQLDGRALEQDHRLQLEHTVLDRAVTAGDQRGVHSARTAMKRLILNLFLFSGARQVAAGQWSHEHVVRATVHRARALRMQPIRQSLT